MISDAGIKLYFVFILGFFGWLVAVLFGPIWAVLTVCLMIIGMVCFLSYIEYTTGDKDVFGQITYMINRNRVLLYWKG